MPRAQPPECPWGTPWLPSTGLMAPPGEMELVGQPLGSPSRGASKAEAKEGKNRENWRQRP